MEIQVPELKESIKSITVIHPTTGKQVSIEYKILDNYIKVVK